MMRNHRAHVVVVCGPAGSGKSTIAKALSADFDHAFIEGDEYHTEQAVRKMSQDEPLTDTDRWDWLIRIREAAAKSIHEGASSVVLSCSALKKKYRDVLRIIALQDDITLQFVYLRVPVHLLVQRVEARTNHYMKAVMLQSQLQSLEDPSVDEWDVITIEADKDLSTVLSTVRGIVQARKRAVVNNSSAM